MKDSPPGLRSRGDMESQTFRRTGKDSRHSATLRHWAAFATLAIVHSFGICAVPAHADPVDDLIAKRMRQRHITGLSLAIIDEGRIVRAQAYGFTDKSHTTP